MKLVWTRYRDPLFGLLTYRLDGLPEGCCGVARGHAGRYIAHAHIGGRYLSHVAGTLSAAMRRLEREIDRRSIGLLRADIVEFVTREESP